MTLPWSKEQTMMLIELYRNHPCLWNVKLTDYRDRDKRAAALKSLAEEMKEERNLTTNELKRKKKIMIKFEANIVESLEN